MRKGEAQHAEVRAPGPWVAIVLLPFAALTLPAALILAGPLESNGWPPRLLAFWIAAATAIGWVARRSPRGAVSPAEKGAWVLFGALVVALAATGLRHLVAEEAAGALRAGLVMVPLVVVTMVVASTADRRRVEQLVTALVLGIAISSVVALAQQVMPFNLAEVIRPPGMVAREIGGFGTRGEFTRVKGAAAHPIEFGVIGGALLPVCIHLARFARTHVLRVVAAGATVLLLLAIPLTVSRSGVLVVLVSMTAYAMVLSNRQRANVLVLALAGAVITRAVVPGLLGALRGIFSNAPTDDSITARTDDYPIVDALFMESPWVGHGLGTFRPDVYFYLDNQYLLSLIEGGLVLVLATLTFFALTLASARGARRRARTAADASLAQAVLAGVAGIAVSGAFFDLFSFAQVTVVLFVLSGIAGAVWRLSVQDGDPLPSPIQRLRGAVVRMTPPADATRSQGGVGDWIRS